MQQYLDRYAEAQALTISQSCSEYYDRVLVLPAYAEATQPILDIIEHCRRANALAIVVVNVPDNAPQKHVDRSIKLVSELTLQSSNVLLVNRVNDPIPHKQGVGLARKLGTDIALHLIAQKKINTPWIYQTDADVELPENYFFAALGDEGAAVFGHRHRTQDETLRQAIDLYDAHMQHYINGLAHAGSRYAFPTLGSTIAIHAQAYAAVRGFPKRNAGEDFYLLNKIAKHSVVTTHPAVTIEVEARHSDRVPFGTGPALRRISTALCAGEPVTTYNPEVFKELRDTLNCLDEFAHNGVTLSQQDTARHRRLQALGWDKVETRLKRNNPQPQRRLNAVHGWFDALKTLRYVNACEVVFPRIPTQAVLAKSAK